MVHLLAPLPYAAEAAWLMLLLYISKAGMAGSCGRDGWGRQVEQLSLNRSKNRKVERRFRPGSGQ